MNALFLYNAAAFFALFMLLGLLVVKLYRRKVEGPLRQLEKLTEALSQSNVLVDYYRESYQKEFRRKIQLMMELAAQLRARREFEDRVSLYHQKVRALYATAQEKADRRGKEPTEVRKQVEQFLRSAEGGAQ